jgi:hypothetical protein
MLCCTLADDVPYCSKAHDFDLLSVSGSELLLTDLTSEFSSELAGRVQHAHVILKGFAFRYRRSDPISKKISTFIHMYVRSYNKLNNSEKG